MNINEKQYFTKEDLSKILAEKEQEWRFKFLKDFKANIILTPDNFKKLLEEFIRTIKSINKDALSEELINKFLFSFISKEEIKKQKNYEEIYNRYIEQFKKPEIKAPIISSEKSQIEPEKPKEEIKEIPVEIKETIVRRTSQFNPLEIEIMTNVLKKFFNEQITSIISQIKPELAEKIKNNKKFYDYRTFFQFLNKIVKPEWVDNDQFFQKGWREFADISRNMYLALKKDTKISGIRPGEGVRNFTKANFYGMLLTADYCADEIKNPKIGFNFNSCIKYFTLAFEKEPEEVLEEVKLINRPESVEIFKLIIMKILNNESSVSKIFFDELNNKSIFVDVLNSGSNIIEEIFIKFKKIYYLSLIYNYCVVLIGKKTLTGYINEKSEPLVFYHPQIINKFKAVVKEQDWSIDPETTELAIKINVFKNTPGEQGEWLIPNLIRAIIESIKVELPLLNTTNLVKGQNVKQGMERELDKNKYFEPVIKILLENKNNIRTILSQTKRR
ncbi:MAG TPA: hypothetical protein PLD27_07410 [bacterium]|nr:hypothetical protein [bacterium]HPQ18961.1 hypothetical protein [bacterium]